MGKYYLEIERRFFGEEIAARGNANECKSERRQEQAKQRPESQWVSSFSHETQRCLERFALKLRFSHIYIATAHCF